MSAEVKRALDQIRRAAFELRHTDPNEAARLLRRVVRQGGETEALAHGALGELLMDVFDDVDGALHHFRKLLSLAPGLPAGELGLARALVRNGQAEDALDAYLRSLAGLETFIRACRDANEPAPGVEEAVLTALELSVEARELAREHPTSQRLPEPDTSLLQWAEDERLFDADDDPFDTLDWERFAALRATLAALEGQLETALTDVSRVTALVPLPTESAHRIRSQVFEAAGDARRAADEGRLGLGDFSQASADELWRVVGLFEQTEREDDAGALLKAARPAIEAWVVDGEDLAEQRQLLQEIDERLRSYGPTLVTLGKRK